MSSLLSFPLLNDYEILKEEYFEHPGILPPLVRKDWLIHLEAVTKNYSALSSVQQESQRVNRKRGRPKKIHIEKPQSPEIPEEFCLFDDDSASDHGFSEPLWGELSDNEANVPNVNIDNNELITCPTSPQPLIIDESKEHIATTSKFKNRGALIVEGIKTDWKVFYPCPECGRKFSAPSTLKYHYRLHSGDLLCCETCGRGFTNRYLLKCHQRVHTGELFQCNVCERGFTTAELLKVHRRGHTGEKPYHCEVCRKTFRSASNLSQHKETHLEEKMFLCPQCGASFNQRRCLEGHMLVHKEKSHVCPTCGKQWARRSDMTEHMRIHTGEKPFSCRVCSHRFTQAGSLKRHLATHQQPTAIPCQLCDKLFKNETNYQKHLAKHFEIEQET